MRVGTFPGDAHRTVRPQMGVGSIRRGRMVIWVRVIDDLNAVEHSGSSPPPHGGPNLGSSSSSAPNQEPHQENPQGFQQNYGDGGENSNPRSGFPNSSNSASDEKEAGSSRNILGSEPFCQEAGLRETHFQGSMKRPFGDLNKGDDGFERKKSRNVHEATDTEIGTNEKPVMAAENATQEQFSGKANALANAAKRPGIYPKENVGHGENPVELGNETWNFSETNSADDLSSPGGDQTDLGGGDDDEASRKMN